jgi:hypothetical protein
MAVVGVGTASAATPVWPAASEAALPASAAAGVDTQNADLRDVTCTSHGNCVAVGRYVDAAYGNYNAMIATESGGVWGVPSDIALPTGFYPTSTGDQDASLFGVTCTSPGNCVAVGSYSDASDASQAMAVTETGGVWGQAVAITLPSPHVTSALQNADLYKVSCTSPGNCVAGGAYMDANSGSNDDYQAMVADEVSGAWQTATKVALPSGAETAAEEQDAGLYGLVCSSPGNCSATGYYTDDPGNDFQAMTDTETAGVWAQAKELALPAGAAPIGEQAAYLESETCTSPGDCTSVGAYADTTGVSQPMAASSTNGVWSQATKIALPADTEIGADKYATELDGVSCTSTANCVTVGYYTDTAGEADSEPMFASETNGVWSPLVRLTLPAGYNPDSTDDQDSGLSGVSCTGVGSCVAVGEYTDTHLNYQAMTVSSVPSLALATSSLPPAVIGTPYSAQLSATGGVGTYAWSLSSGLLPAGLTLDAATGLISGTPTAVDSAAFTAAVSDPGPPVQTASAPLSIAVGGPGLGAVKVKNPQVSVVIICSAAVGLTCTGEVGLSAVEHFTGHKLTAVSAKHKKKPKKTTKTVGLGRTSYTVAGGASVTETVRLGSLAKPLLKKSHNRLRAELAVTPTGLSTPSVSETITITPAKKKHKTHH